MKELSLHILDLAHNSIRANASTLKISIDEDYYADRIEICIRDNGDGIKEDKIEQLKDPFYSTKNKKKVGLGVPLFVSTCQMCHGDLEIKSSYGKGTLVKAHLQLSHIDRPVLGDIASVIAMLMVSYSNVSINFKYKIGQRSINISSKKLMKILEIESLNLPSLNSFIKGVIQDNIDDLNLKTSV